MTATPLADPQRSSPRPSVWATESPTRRIRSTGGGAIASGVVAAVGARLAARAATVGPVFGSVAAPADAEPMPAPASAAVGFCTARNTIFGADELLGTLTKSAATAAAPAVAASSGFQRARNVPYRIGRSIQRKETVATAIVSASRSPKSA